jgi:formate hydrogenlyase subunit 3/multisubunit Na+/H+ antiporter MnhD subunit
MLLPPTIPIAFLILGALAILAGHLAHLRQPSLIMSITALITLAMIWTLRSDSPVSQIIAPWQPVSVFGVPVSFRVDHTAWIIGLGLVLVCVATALTWLAYPGQTRPAPRAVALLLIASALASVFASNLLTLALAWGLLDTLFTIALLARSGSQLGRRAAIAIVLNIASTLCVWIAALVIENQHTSLYWHLLNAQSGPMGWLVAAAVLRLGLYPLHQWLPVELGQETDRAVLLFVIPSATGLALLARLAISQALPAQSIMPLLASLSALMGAFLAWRSPQPRSGLPFIALSFTGLMAISATTPTAVGTLLAATLNWIFVMSALFISRGFKRTAPWWSIGAIVAAMSLIGVPGTIGFIVREQTISSLIDSGSWISLVACLIAETLLVASVIRLIFSPAGDSLPINFLRKISFGVALLFTIVPSIALAVLPATITNVPLLPEMLNKLGVVGWIAWAVPLVGGIAVAVSLRKPAAVLIIDLIDPEAEPRWQRLLELDWITSVASLPIRFITYVVRGLSSVLEGEGSLLWTMLLIVIALVLYSGAIK